jgi:lipoprotein-anchoring transpeptidase ErfK/SrfK
MRALIILILLAAAGGGAWYWFKHQQPSAADDPFNPTSPVISPAAALPAEAKQALDQAESLWSQAGADAPRSPAAPRMAKLFSQALSAMYDLPGGHDAEEALLRDRLTPLGEALFFSKAKWPNDDIGLMAVHSVSPGENPDAIARSYGMSREFLNRLRGKDVNSADLRSGETIKIVKVKDAGGYHMDVDLSDYTLDLFIGGVFAKRYTIAHGAAESPTPVGRTQITNRVWHPQWTHPTSKKVLQYGDPENILGPIWLAFDSKLLGASSIGIHGYTGADGKMQAQVSNGCIRMQNQDAEEVFQVIANPDRSPTSVTIRQ